MVSCTLACALLKSPELKLETFSNQKLAKADILAVISDKKTPRFDNARDDIIIISSVTVGMHLQHSSPPQPVLEEVSGRMIRQSASMSRLLGLVPISVQKDGQTGKHYDTLCTHKKL